MQDPALQKLGSAQQRLQQVVTRKEQAIYSHSTGICGRLESAMAALKSSAADSALTQALALLWRRAAACACSGRELFNGGPRSSCASYCCSRDVRAAWSKRSGLRLIWAGAVALYCDLVCHLQYRILIPVPAWITPGSLLSLCMPKHAPASVAAISDVRGPTQALSLA